MPDSTISAAPFVTLTGAEKFPLSSASAKGHATSAEIARYAQVGTLKDDGSVAMAAALVTNVGTFTSAVANGAAAKGFAYNTPAYTTTAKLASWANNGIEKAYIQQGGAFFTGSAVVSSNGTNNTGYFGGVYFNGTNLTAAIDSPSYVRTYGQGIDFVVGSGGNPAGTVNPSGSTLLSLSSSTGATFGANAGMSGSYFGLKSTALLRFSSDPNWYGTTDLALYRNAAGVVEVNNGTAGTFRDIKVRSYLVDATNTAPGTTGAQTINKSAGTVNFAAAATSLVVTNSLVTASSLVFCTIRTNDATAVIKNVVPAAGSFTINLNAAATAETSVGFIVHN